ncbi:MAG: 2-C-methyl-D-erythritol 2,4-cyclodiphosphate synthase [Candidatus Omnitrophota bacterium]|nr:MAG: 2-C-methyl-D-erythritol 2,4-cyclodiphosphate synthase [Candidatus Omnitrophota bacterium]
MAFRIGIGYDIHRLTEGRKLFIGGVEIYHHKGLLGHSDGDVLLHAICDALLGASGEVDIGELFPDSDPKFKGISSRELLESVVKMVIDKNFTINNLDAVVIVEEPKLTSFKEKMRQEIARLLQVDQGQVSIKAKTNEGIGKVGQKEAIAAYAVVSLATKENK